MTSTFKAYVFESFGAPLEQLKLRTDMQPVPLEASRVRIKVASAAINPIDWMLIKFGATISHLPHTPTPERPVAVGFDVCGEVVAVGSDVQKLKAGDHVFAMSSFSSTGTLAEFVDLDEKFVALKPKNLSQDEAAGVPLASLTAYQSVVTYGKLQAGQRVLILGSSGGVGSFAVQFAKAIGAHVIATASPRNTEYVKSLGVDQVIDYTTTKWVDVIEPHSLDLIFDCGFEPKTWDNEAQTCLKTKTGAFVTLAGERSKEESATGTTLHKVVVEPSAADLNEIAKFIEDGKVKVILNSVYPFEKAPEAMQLLMAGCGRGKIVIQVQKQ